MEYVIIIIVLLLVASAIGMCMEKVGIARKKLVNKIYAKNVEKLIYNYPRMNKKQDYDSKLTKLDPEMFYENTVQGKKSIADYNKSVKINPKYVNR